MLALAGALVAVGTLALLPDELDAANNCLPRELKSRLAQVSQKFGQVDFNPPRGKYSQVASWLKANHSGGVGTYSCGMHHIHIDSGPAYRFHHCQSASAGEEMDGAAIRAAKAEWPTAPNQGSWPLVLPSVTPGAKL
jgi:hypothetical protein